MAEAETAFDYVALDPAGRRVRGVVKARTDAGAFERLKRDGLSPVRIRTARAAKASAGRGGKALSDREVAELLADLAALLRAGSDIRSALSIIGARAGRPAVQAACRALAADISGGGALDQAFARHLTVQQAFVAALVAAGESAGDLAGGLERGAEILESRLQISEQLVSVLSYPAFVLVSTLAALTVILVLVVPSLAPLAEAPGAEPGLAMGMLLAASGFLRGNFLMIGLGLAALAVGGVLGFRSGALSGPFERLVLDGPMSRTARALVFGGFAIALGNVLSAGAPMAEGLRHASRAVRSGVARRRLDPVANAVRQGEALSDALAVVPGFPPAIVRLAAIGEMSGALGAMLARGGKIEERAALRRIEAVGRLLGPALIVALGGVIGLLMAGLLSGVTGLGEAALQ